MTHRTDAERAHREPTGVFVRLPLDAAQEERFDRAYFPTHNIEDALVAIGTPVTGGDLPVITTLGTLRDPVPCVRQSDALAKIAEKDAEITQLRNLLARLRDVVSRGLTQSQTLPGEKYPIGSHHHPVWVEIARALEVPEDRHD